MSESDRHYGDSTPRLGEEPSIAVGDGDATHSIISEEDDETTPKDGIKKKKRPKHKTKWKRTRSPEVHNVESDATSR